MGFFSWLFKGWSFREFGLDVGLASLAKKLISSFVGERVVENVKKAVGGEERLDDMLAQSRAVLMDVVSAGPFPRLRQMLTNGVDKERWQVTFVTAFFFKYVYVSEGITNTERSEFLNRLARARHEDVDNTGRNRRRKPSGSKPAADSPKLARWQAAMDRYEDAQALATVYTFLLPYEAAAHNPEDLAQVIDLFQNDLSAKYVEAVKRFWRAAAPVLRQVDQHAGNAVDAGTDFMNEEFLDTRLGRLFGGGPVISNRYVARQRARMEREDE